MVDHKNILRLLTIDCCWGIVVLVLLSGCGSLTGIPGHGGGKRFAIEQELVAAATRATIKQIDLTPLQGRKVNLFVNAIGDTGSGNLIGGRFSVVSQLRGDYIQTPIVTEKSIYPQYTSTSSTSSTTNSSSGDVDSSSSTSSDSSTSTTLPSPEKTTNKEKGAGGELQVGVEYDGLGAYQNSDEISSDDLQYLSGLLESYLFLQGVHIVPPSEAEIDVYITVDVFGTVRTRIEWFLANNEILRAKTALEVMAVEHDSGKLMMKPQASSIEAEYNEQYILWMGPIIITKYLHESSPLLSDFTDLGMKKKPVEMQAQNEEIPYPFKYQLNQSSEEEK